MKKPVICVLGTFDTKAEEFGYLMERIREQGAETLSLNAGFHGETTLAADVPCEELVRRGGGDMATIHTVPRNEGMGIVIRGAKAIARELYDAGKIDGVIGMGGSGGTTLATGVMEALPLGFPKLVISTLGGSAKIGRYVGGRDIMILNSVVDVSGVNSITRRVYCEAAGAIVGAAKGALRERDAGGKPRIAATMYGLTTPGVQAAKQYLEEHGYEVIVFHATGSGGRAMEALIREGFFAGVLDMTLPEVTAWVLNVAASSPGEGRLAGAALSGVPQVVCPGAMDMVSTTDFNQYPDRKVYCHNTTPSHFRPNAEDVRKAARYMAENLNRSQAPCAVYFPKGGLSMVDHPGKPMYNPEADGALLETLRERLDPARVELHESEADINDAGFAVMLAKRLDEMIQSRNRQ